MTTILTVQTGGKRKRVCNATCHHATRLSCRCICGGKYHGTGNAAATNLAQDIISGEPPLVPQALPGFGVEGYTVGQEVIDELYRIRGIKPVDNCT